MSKLRFGLFALVCTGVLAAAATLAVGTKPASGGGKHHGPPVSRDVRQMLHEVSSRNIEQTIQKLLAQHPGVREVEVDFASGQASVLFDRGAVSISKLMDALNAAGYRATGFTQGQADRTAL